MLRWGIFSQTISPNNFTRCSLLLLTMSSFSHSMIWATILLKKEISYSSLYRAFLTTAFIILHRYIIINILLNQCNNCQKVGQPFCFHYIKDLQIKDCVRGIFFWLGCPTFWVCLEKGWYNQRLYDSNDWEQHNLQAEIEWRY